MNRCKLHPLIKLPCYVCTGVDEYAGANEYPPIELQYGPANKYPPIEFKSLKEVLDGMRISKETGAFARDQDFYSMLNDLRNSMVNGFETIQSDIREVRKMQSHKRGW